MITPEIVCNNILRRGFNESVPITPMKLQKLLYLLSAYFYWRYNTLLFANRFETWDYGPVMPEVYHCFKKYRRRAIDAYYYIGNDLYTVSESNPQFKHALDTVWSKYSESTATELSDMTHEDGSAWVKAFGDRQRFLADEDIKRDGERWFEKSSSPE